MSNNDGYKKENKEIKKVKSVSKLNDYRNKINYQFKKNPNLKYKLNIVDSNCISGLNDIFEVYISYKDNKEYLVSKKNYDLDIFSLLDNKKIISLSGHQNKATTIRYFINNKDMNEYLISGDLDKIVIIWDISNNYRIKYKINTNYLDRNYIFSCLLIFPHFGCENYIITSCSNYFSISKIYSFNTGKFIKNIKDSQDIQVHYLLSWYNKKNNKYYVIQFGKECIIINNIIEDELYVTLYATLEDEYEGHHDYGFIFTGKDNIDYLYSTYREKNIIIWDLYNKIISKKIEIKYNITYIIQWNDKYIIFTDRNDGSFKIMDLEKNVIISNIKAYIKDIKCIKKINHPIYGESLLSAGEDEIIKLWCT